MRKILIASFVLSLLALFVWIIPVKAEKPDMPKGLEDRGPLTKITFIHYRRGYAKPNNAKKPSGPTCYGFLASGAKWKSTEGYEINPANGENLSSDFILGTFNKSTDEWDNEVAFQIFGAGSIVPGAIYRTDIADGDNVVVFDDYPDSRVIAVTTIWGYFYGPPKMRELVEWDMLFNDRFVWGNVDSDSSSVMDLQNIATHELGHSAGMDDLYNTSCSLETMYGYSIEGETIKRDLNTGDIAGIKTLYK